MKIMKPEFDTFHDLLDYLVCIELRKKKLWEEEIKRLPKGSLFCCERSDGVFYYHCFNGRKVGITRDLDMLYALARKKYLKTITSAQKNNIKRICNILRTGKYINSPMSEGEQLLHYYGKLGLDILRITCNKKQYQWAKGNYSKNQKYPEQLVFKTYSGIKVRSKSEKDIGNALEVNGIPYRYEQEIKLDIGWMKGVSGGTMGAYKTYYPDFTILTFTGEYIIWEHLGRVDLPDYRAHNMEKIAAYRQSGLVFDHSLILTFEHDLRSKSSMARIIETRILPYVD